MAEVDTKKMVEDMIAGLGGLAEMAAVYRDHLILNGFTREEAVVMSSNLVCSIMTKSE